MGEKKNISGKNTVCATRRSIRAAAAIVPLIFLSLFLAAFIISAANDVYAFVKPDIETRLALNGEEPLFSVAERLEEEGIISEPLIFSLYAKLKGYEERISGFCGEIRLSASMGYREIIASFSENVNNGAEYGE